MNDFTIEQLIDLNVILCVWNVKYPDDKSILEVQQTILNLIDNYCEHKNIGQCAISEQSVCRDCGEELH